MLSERSLYINLLLNAITQRILFDVLISFDIDIISILVYLHYLENDAHWKFEMVINFLENKLKLNMKIYPYVFFPQQVTVVNFRYNIAIDLKIKNKHLN